MLHSAGYDTSCYHVLEPWACRSVSQTRIVEVRDAGDCRKAGSRFLLRCNWKIYRNLHQHGALASLAAGLSGGMRDWSIALEGMRIESQQRNC